MPWGPASGGPEESMYRLVLVRHGESVWNQENRFTGWTDVDLNDRGRQEARDAGRLMTAEKLEFDVAHTSVLKRAIRTLWMVLDEMHLMWIPVSRSWRLNESHYGALQGLNKAETAAKHSDDQGKIWRRMFELAAAPLEEADAAEATSRRPRWRSGMPPGPATTRGTNRARCPRRSRSRTRSRGCCPTGTRR